MAIQLLQQILVVYRDEFDDVLLQRFFCRERGGLGDGFLRPFGVASVPLRQAANVGNGVVEYLALHGAAGPRRRLGRFFTAVLLGVGGFLLGPSAGIGGCRVLAVQRHGRGGAQVRGRCHRGNVAGEQDVGTGAVRASSGRSDVGRYRDRRTEDVLHHVTHRLDQATRRVDIDDDEFGVLFLGMADAAREVICCRDADAAVDFEDHNGVVRGVGSERREGTHTRNECASD